MMDSKKLLMVFVVALIFFVGCGVGSFHKTIEDPDMIIGIWESDDKQEFLEISKDIVVKHEKYTEYHYKVHGRGCSVFTPELNDLNINRNIEKKRLEADGTVMYGIYKNPKANSSTFIVKWKDLGKDPKWETTLGFFEDSRLSLYTYTTDPDFPDAMLRLYKTK